jgi:hypothetical protein
MSRRRNPFALPTPSRRQQDFLLNGYLRPERRRRRRRRPGLWESLLRAWLRSKPDDTGIEAIIRARQLRE